MLLAVEGGGFFSASASGYSKGLTLLLLGQKNEEKPMRVRPWSQYQLVDQESNSDLQLASGKKRLVRGCASFVCFRHTASRREGPSLKVGPTQKQDVLPEPPISDNGKDDSKTTNPVDNDLKAKQVDLKSSLKKTRISIPVSGGVVNESDAVSEKNGDVPGYIERRKVQWTDVSGGELVEVREFEPSDDGSDNEFDNGNKGTCLCSIM